MKKFAPSLLALLLFASCGQNRQAPVVASSSAPAALTTESRTDSRLFSKGRTDDLLERLYREQVEKDANLRDLEGQLTALSERKSDSLAALQFFKEKNSDYYAAADKYVKGIHDSLLRLRLLSRLEASSKALDAHMAALEDLLSSIQKKEMSIDDLHESLRVLTTLSMIEGYQRSDLPATAPLRHYLATQEKLERRLRDSTTHKLPE
jgi:hypothetical protein